jgi:signal transduction histidine kinase
VKRTEKSPVSGWLALAILALGLFVLLDLGLFGWLLFRSLSEREIERVLLETRTEAEALARQIAGRAEDRGEDLYTAVAFVREIESYIDEVMTEREVVETVEIRDREGKLVFRNVSEAIFREGPREGLEIVPSEGIEAPKEEQLVHRETLEIDDPTYDLEVPIGELGILHIGISRGELQRRIGVLRQDLIQKASLIGLLTFLTLTLAYLLIWLLWKRGHRLEEQAEEAERMAYVGTLASGLAHEIRNPLNSLNLNIQLLEEELREEALVKSSSRLMSITRDEIGRLERLVTDFLQYARPRPLDLEQLAPGTLLRRCSQVLESEIEAANAVVEIEDRCGDSLVEVDSAQMGQLLINLVQNALHACDGLKRDPVIRMSAFIDGGRAMVEVKDNGGGVKPEDHRRMFDLFYSSRKGGTGLGLAIVDRIARAHQGELEVESVVGDGTTIRLVLPVSKQD